VDRSVALVISAPGLAVEATALFPGPGSAAVLAPAELAPARPFAGALFALLAELSAGACLGLVVPGVDRESALAPDGGGPAESGGNASPARRHEAERARLLAVSDHVNLALRGPLTGRWPAGLSRTFPAMTGVYQPSLVRSAGGARVYSDDVVAAGVGDVRRLTSFEHDALRHGPWPAVADLLVPPVIVAAYYQLKVAACLVA
jgi:hypothetical protein